MEEILQNLKQINEDELKAYVDKIQMETPCDSCQNDGAMLKCSQCKSAYYCDRNCQKNHWKAHKANCIHFSSLLNEMTERNTLQEAQSEKIYDPTSPDACQICTVIPQQNDLRILSCDHRFCGSCLCTFYDQLDKIETEHCPLCRTSHIEPSLWTYAYTNALDFMFQAELYPGDSPLRTLYIQLAQKEYNRLVALTSHLPVELKPIQYDVQSLKLLCSSALPYETLRSNNDERIELGSQLLLRDIKDIAIKLEVTKLLTISLFHGQEYEKSKMLCENIFHEIHEIQNQRPPPVSLENDEESMRNLQAQRKVKAILASVKCQEDIQGIHFLYLQINYELGYHSTVLELAKESVERNRYDLRSYYYLGKVYFDLHQWEFGIEVLKKAFRYMLPWTANDIFDQFSRRPLTVKESIEDIYDQLIYEGFQNYKM